MYLEPGRGHFCRLREPWYSCLLSGYRVSEIDLAAPLWRKPHGILFLKLRPLGFGVQGLGFGVQGLGFSDTILHFCYNKTPIRIKNDHV